MTTTVTDEQIQQLAESAKPFSLALLSWGPDRLQDCEVYPCLGFPGDAVPG
jgi:hypothetical protein